MVIQTVEFQYVDGADRGLETPCKATEGASGYDLRADLLGLNEAKTGLPLKSNEIRLVPTGIRLAMPQGIEGQIRPRSGLAAKYGVTVLNAPGTIDSDYRGELKIILINLGNKEFLIQHGDRIAQLVFLTLPSVALEYRAELTETDRGEQGFGSTGLK